MKSCGDNDAPPINPPSTSCFSKISLAEFGFTLPPYIIDVLSEILFPYLLLNRFLIYL